MANVLVFTTDCKGHHLEYLHHYYDFALRDADNHYVFCVSKDFYDVKSTYSWPEADNIVLDFIADDDLEKCIKGGNGFLNIIKLSFAKSRYLRMKCKEHNIDVVHTIMLMEYLPALPFILPSRIDFRGIIYRIALNDKTLSLKSKIIEKIKYFLLVNSSVFKKVFVLNDKRSVSLLNEKYNTDKFCFLPDPFPQTEPPKDIREDLNIPVKNKIFLHFGGLGRRKGTLLIADTISRMKDAKGFTFIFAGRISKDCDNEFYQILETINNGAQIKVYNEFCTYEFLNSLAYTTDYMLIPYENVTQSSGVLGYAAQYDKPVIGPDAGLLGDLIRNYRLGKLIKYPITVDDLLQAVLSYDSIEPVDGSLYRKENSINNFQQILMKI